MIRCPTCQHENPPQAKFCLDCGARFAVAYAQCGTQLPVGAKFCLECGKPTDSRWTASAAFASPQSYTPRHLAEKILTSKSALEGERKQVTVLFADLKGSMELLADRDPEEARKLLDPVLERMMEAVHRYEGTVNQLMGDGIMALFGAPLAHEDHAVRACYAALRMQESVKRYADGVFRSYGIPLRIRVGLNSGEVVVRAIGSDLHMDYTAVGQTTHLAARMEQMALPGGTLLTPATLQLAEGYVEVRTQGPVSVKGLPEPVEVYELIGAGAVRSRLHAAAARGLTRFVGRDSEADQLRQTLERAQAGHGQVVATVGEPGVGKSRLYWEFTHSHRVHGWLILESGSVSYGKATAYLPVIDLLKAYFHIEGRDDTRTIREKVTGKVLSLDRALEPSLSALLSLLEVSLEDEAWGRLDPSQRRQRTLDAVKRLLLRESQVQPLLLLVEDLHWIDAETQALLDGLVESLPTAQLLLLVNYRPEYEHRWGSKTYCRQLRIDPLPAESAEDLLASLLGADAGLAPLKRMLIERTEGNPLFLEESVRTLVETQALIGARGAYRLAHDAPAIRIPATVQAILAARIDRLTPEDKQLLQAAAVIGKDVPFALLLAVSELAEEDARRGVAHLQAAEFLYEARLFPELEYTFKHALTHEVTYGGLLQDRRRDLHARIVAMIETLRLDEQIERLAHHAVRGEVWEKAVHYLWKGGVKAAAQSALLDARARFEQALSILEGLPQGQAAMEQGFEIRLELKIMLALLGETRRALEPLREALALAERLNDDARRCRVWANMTHTHSMLGELEEALAAGAHALEIAERLGVVGPRLVAMALLEQAHYFRGDYQRVLTLATDILAVLPADLVHERVESSGVMPISIFARFFQVLSLGQLGRFSEADSCAAEMLQLAGPAQNAFTVGQAHLAAGRLHLFKGDWGKARSQTEQGLAVFRTGNSVLDLALTVTASAWILAQVGESREALSRFREGGRLVDLLSKQGAATQLMAACHSLGCARLLLGRLDEARDFADRVLTYSPSRPGFTPHALQLLGDIATHPDRFDAESGEAHYREAPALAETRGMRPVVAHCHLGLGKLYRRTGDHGQAKEHLDVATAMYREMDMRFWLEQTEAEMRQLA